MAAVETVPTVNGRYSSPSVGARKARYTDARSASDSTTCHSAPSRGLSCVSFCDGNCWVFMPVGVVSSSCPSRRASGRAGAPEPGSPARAAACPARRRPPRAGARRRFARASWPGRQEEERAVRRTSPRCDGDQRRRRTAETPTVARATPPRSPRHRPARAARRRGSRCSAGWAGW